MTAQTMTRPTRAARVTGRYRARDVAILAKRGLTHGHGYVGERKWLDDVTLWDSVVALAANAQGWTPGELAAWMDSAEGRHFGDLAKCYAADDAVSAYAAALRWGFFTVADWTREEIEPYAAKAAHVL